MSVSVTRSPLKTKKFRASWDGGHVDFGAAGYEDYTIHKDDERKARYVTRHRAHEHWADFHTAGFWSRWLLWNKPTLRASAADISRRFGLHVILRR